MPSNVIDINEELNARTGQDYLSTAQRAFHDSFADFAEETAGVITFPDGWIDEKAKLAAELLADLDGPVSIQTSVRVDVHLTEDQQAAMRRALQDQAHQIVKTMQDRAREIVARRVLQIAMPLAD